MDQRKFFEGVSQIESGDWVATFGEWTARYQTEWEAVVARDIHAIETEGEEAPTTLKRSAIKDLIRRGGWDYIRTEAGTARCFDLVSMATMIMAGPLPMIENAPRGRPMKKARVKRQSRFKGVHSGVGRWQAKLGTKYVGSAGDERVAALMRDVGALDRLFDELNYPIEFVMEARAHGVKSLGKAEVLALFINRLDDQIALREQQRALVGATPEIEDPTADARGEDPADDFFAGPDPATGEPIPLDRIERGLGAARAVQGEAEEPPTAAGPGEPATGSEATDPTDTEDPSDE